MISLIVMLLYANFSYSFSKRRLSYMSGSLFVAQPISIVTTHNTRRNQAIVSAIRFAICFLFIISNCNHIGEARHTVRREVKELNRCFYSY